MSFRITQRSIGQQALAGLQSNLGRLGNVQQQLSSGKMLSKPSDSPTGTVSAMQFRSEIRTNQQWVRNAEDGLGWLGTIDQTLTTSLDAVRRARELTLQGMNSGALSPDAKTAMAIEIESLRDGLISAANTKYLDRPVFGGTTSGSTAYSAAGVYVGSPTSTTRTVGADARVQVDQPGPGVFEAGGVNLFTVLADIATSLRTGNDAALSAGLGSLDSAMKNVQYKLSEVGAKYAQVEQMQRAAENRVLSLSGALSQVEDIDLPKTIVELQMQQMSYEAALGATQRIITPSLADFLR